MMSNASRISFGVTLLRYVGVILSLAVMRSVYLKWMKFNWPDEVLASRRCMSKPLAVPLARICDNKLSFVACDTREYPNR